MNGEKDFGEAILDQESRGQQAVVATQRLPKNTRGDWSILQSWGIVKGDDVDDLFCEAALPDGWQVKATSHPMWNELQDERGLTRATFFYKASFYDRAAFMNVRSNRFVGGDEAYAYPRDSVAEAPVIRDCARGCVVESLPIIKYAVHKQHGLGALCDGVFYYEATGHSDASFAKRADVTPDVEAITNDRFYADHRHQGDGAYPTIYAVDNLAKALLEQAIKKYPADDSQWSPEWDLPEIVVP